VLSLSCGCRAALRSGPPVSDTLSQKGSSPMVALVKKYWLVVVLAVLAWMLVRKFL
jgi:hypothetical protein